MTFAAYSVATVSFQDNLLYQLIAEEDFIGLYRLLQHIVDHEFVLIAERHNEPVGFIFAVPDLLQGERGETINTLIVKSLGILPGHQYAGSWLSASGWSPIDGVQTRLHSLDRCTGA